MLGTLVKRHFRGRSHRLLVAILAFGLLIRVFYAWQAQSLDPLLGENPLHGDALGYHTLAENLLLGEGFTFDRVHPSSYRMPGYPAFLATIYVLIGENFLMVRLLQALFGALLCIPVYLVALRLTSETAALLSALAVTVHPVLIYMTGWVYSETIYILLFWIGIAFLAAALGGERWRFAIFSGAFLGLATYFRQESLLLLPAVACYGIVAGWNRKAILKTLTAQVVLVSLIAPWSVRNYMVHGQWIMLTSSGGYCLYAGNNPNSRGGAAFLGSLPGMTELEAGSELSSRAKQWIRENPVDFSKNLFLKLEKFFSPSSIVSRGSGSLGRNDLIIHGLYWMFLVLALFGGWRARKTQLGGILLAAIGLHVVVALVFFGGTRLALPVAPALIVLAGFGIQGLRRARVLLDERSHLPIQHPEVSS